MVLRPSFSFSCEKFCGRSVDFVDAQRASCARRYPHGTSNHAKTPKM